MCFLRNSWTCGHMCYYIVRRGLFHRHCCFVRCKTHMRFTGIWKTNKTGCLCGVNTSWDVTVAFEESRKPLIRRMPSHQASSLSRPSIFLLGLGPVEALANTQLAPNILIMSAPSLFSSAFNSWNVSCNFIRTSPTFHRKPSFPNLTSAKCPHRWRAHSQMTSSKSPTLWATSSSAANSQAATKGTLA